MHCGDQRHLGLCLGYVPALAYGSCRVSDQGTTLRASDLHNARATILNPFNIIHFITHVSLYIYIHIYQSSHIMVVEVEIGMMIAPTSISDWTPYVWSNVQWTINKVPIYSRTYLRMLIKCVIWPIEQACCDKIENSYKLYQVLVLWFGGENDWGQWISTV